MTDQLMLTVPENIAERAREIASSMAQCAEQVLINYLNTFLLPSDVQGELDALHYLLDDALWTITREQMPADIQARAQVLMSKNSHGSINDEEHHELEALVERGDRLMLRKAEAGSVLRQRGFPFSQKDFLPSR